MIDFYKKIVFLDILDNYYLKWPSSGYVLGRLPNVEMRVYRMRGIPIGTSVELPEYVQKSKSITWHVVNIMDTETTTIYVCSAVCACISVCTV